MDNVGRTPCKYCTYGKVAFCIIPLAFSVSIQKICMILRSDCQVCLNCKGRCNYGVDLWYNQKSSHPKFHIHFFIDNFNVNISLHTLSCPKLKFGQLKAYKLMFALELSMKKWIKKFWIAGFLVKPAVEKCLRRNCISLYQSTFFYLA